MNDDQLILYAFIKNCPRLVKAAQDNALKLIDIKGYQYTFKVDFNYLPTEQDYMDFLFDLDDSDIVYQMQFVNGSYFIKLYT